VVRSSVSFYYPLLKSKAIYPCIDIGISELMLVVQTMPREPSWSVEKFFQQSSDTQIDAATLQQLAKRAQLTIAPEKEESLCREVGQILSCVHIIQEVPPPTPTAGLVQVGIPRAALSADQPSQVNTEGVEPLVSPLDARQAQLRLRADEVTDGDIAEDLMRNAPARDGSFFVVPKVKGQSGGEGGEGADA
jgi:Asp-tRNA(Asn)/Glu-tRNA(Gln) amidotransferase C subunit